MQLLKLWLCFNWSNEVSNLIVLDRPKTPKLTIECMLDIEIGPHAHTAGKSGSCHPCINEITFVRLRRTSLGQVVVQLATSVAQAILHRIPTGGHTPTS